VHHGGLVIVGIVRGVVEGATERTEHLERDRLDPGRDSEPANPPIRVTGRRIVGVLVPEPALVHDAGGDFERGPIEVVGLNVEAVENHSDISNRIETEADPLPEVNATVSRLESAVSISSKSTVTAVGALLQLTESTRLPSM